MKQMINFQPNWTSLPGKTLARILQEREISKSDFAQSLGKDLSFVEGIIDGKISISEDVAYSFENVIGTSAKFWINRQQQYQEQIERVNSLLAEDWIKKFPIIEMVKNEWIPKPNNIRESINILLEFFNVQDIKTWQRNYSKNLKSTNFRQSQKINSTEFSLLVWLRKGELKSESIVCNDWDKAKFEKSLVEIKKLTRIKSPQNFIPTLQKICAECGVALVILPNIKGCAVNGAARKIGESKRLIQLTFRHLSDDQFWFTFFHEAGHLILHDSHVDTFIDYQTEHNPIEEMERDANLFATEALVPYHLRPMLYAASRNKRGIIGLANELGVSPGIIVGQMQHHKIIDFKYLNSFKRHYSKDDINNIISEN